MRLNILKSWSRSDLAIRSWSNIHAVKGWIGNSSLEICRDSICLIVKDSSVPVRHLVIGQDDDSIEKWASPQYLSHIASKQNVNVAQLSSASSKYDPLLEASSNHKVDYKYNQKKE